MPSPPLTFAAALNRWSQFVTSTPVTSLSTGPYCKSLRHLCLDWDVAFESAAMLEQCAGMQVGLGVPYVFLVVGVLDG